MRLVTPARLLAETKVGSTAHFFTLRSQFKDYGATQIYAGDETGPTGDGTRARAFGDDAVALGQKP